MKKKLLSLVVLCLVTISFSCDKSQDSVDNTQEKVIDYSMYKSRDNIYAFLDENKHQKISKRSANEDYSEFRTSIDSLNSYFGTSLEITAFDKYQINNVEEATLLDYHEKGFINKLDYEIISKFLEDEDRANFDTAISNLEYTILNSRLSESDFGKYSLLLNTFKVTNEYYSQKGIDIFNNSANAASRRTPRENWGCAVAIAANAVSTYGLTSCFVPGPNCWAAIAGKGLSLLGMYFSC